jgi:hypothetical protein
MASARKPLSFANKPCHLKDDELIVAKEEGTANSVPAAAVIQRSQALFGFTGREISGLNPEMALETTLLEDLRGDWNTWCSSEMRRYQVEHQWRRRIPGKYLTLRHES